MDSIGQTHARVLASLWTLEGTAWLEVQSEIHEAYKEVPFWFLLAPGCPAIEAHARFWRILEPEWGQFGEYRVTVSYKSISEGGVLWYGFFDDLDGMRRALTPAGWRSPVRQGLEAARIFRAGRQRPGPVKPKARKPDNLKKRR